VGGTPLTLSGNGVGGMGALYSMTGPSPYVFSSWVGPITLASNATVGIAQGGTLTLGGVLSGSGRLTEKGGSNSQLVLTAKNTYTGGTVVQSGVLVVNGTIGAVTVLTGAQLSGTGRTGDVTLSGGTLRPGTPGQDPGTLQTGKVTFSGASTLSVTLNASGGDTQIVAGGGINLNNAHLQISLDGTPVKGTFFELIINNSADPTVGTFAGLPEGSILTIGMLRLQISYKGGASGKDVVLTVV
jgi:autotransporter-associated beta strand protein